MEKRVEAIYAILSREIDDTAPLLVFAGVFQLLISVILSAQTTDEQVNRVTPELFRRFPTPGDLSMASQKEVEEIVHSTGFYRTKAKNIRLTSSELFSRYEGRVPGTMAELLELPGVGRKSANVILGACFGKPAIIVDTHFSRVVRRIGLTDHGSPEKIEKAVGDLVPEDIQYRFSMLINRHGRMTCTARSPKCSECPIVSHCLMGMVRTEDASDG